MSSQFIMPWSNQGPVKLHRGERQDIVPQRRKMDRIRTLATRVGDRFGDFRSRISDVHKKPAKPASPRRTFSTYGEEDIFINPFGVTMRPEKHFENTWENNPYSSQNGRKDDTYERIPDTKVSRQKVARRALGMEDPSMEDYYNEGYRPEPVGECKPSEITTSYEALHYLAKCGRKDMFRTMWRHYRDTRGQGDILHIACRHGHTEMVQALLEQVIDVDLLDPDRVTPIYYAVDSGYEHIVRLLLGKFAVTNVSESVEPGKTILYTAAKKGYLEIVKLTLEHGVNVNEVGEFEYTPLHVAADTGHCDIVKVLLDKNANISALTKSDRTAFEVAVHNKQFEAARILVERGANVARFDGYGRSILHWAAGSSDAETVNFLVDNGASPSIVNKSGTMPHHLAARQGRSLNLHILLSRGARLNAARSLNKETPAQMALMDAIDARKYQCIVILLMHGADVTKPRDDETDFLLRVANIYAHEPTEFGAHVIEAFLFSGHIRFISIAIKDVVEKMSMYHDLGSWYNHLLSRPLSLKNLCRVSIRRQLIKKALGTSIWADVEGLNIAQNVRNFLLMKECDMDNITEKDFKEYGHRQT